MHTADFYHLCDGAACHTFAVLAQLRQWATVLLWIQPRPCCRDKELFDGKCSRLCLSLKLQRDYNAMLLLLLHHINVTSEIQAGFEMENKILAKPGSELGEPLQDFLIGLCPFPGRDNCQFCQRQWNLVAGKIQAWSNGTVKLKFFYSTINLSGVQMNTDNIVCPHFQI